MSFLLVVTGPPGAGKSTVASLVADRVAPSALVSGDAFFDFIVNGRIPPWLPEAHEQNELVTKTAGAAAGRYARAGFATVYDGVLGPWFLPTFAVATGLHELGYVVLLPDVESCVRRVARRQGHRFRDESATRQLHRGFASAAIDRKHVLVDPPERPEEVADLVVRKLDAGDLRVEARGATGGEAKE
ncbi:MAG: ATP-binding protein [Actinomycetota bacterium]|nr:ATP-binding protein [Actinomycetota bacterium]MDQ3787864.1 ATP-binding protein [Actinomycetota bacterium]